jgi:hypothetical protein
MVKRRTDGSQTAEASPKIKQESIHGARGKGYCCYMFRIPYVFQHSAPGGLKPVLGGDGSGTAR